MDDHHLICVIYLFFVFFVDCLRRMRASHVCQFNEWFRIYIDIQKPLSNFVHLFHCCNWRGICQELCKFTSIWIIAIRLRASWPKQTHRAPHRTQISASRLRFEFNEVCFCVGVFCSFFLFGSFCLFRFVKWNLLFLVEIRLCRRTWASCERRRISITIANSTIIVPLWQSIL